jgi:hypothetical protein
MTRFRRAIDTLHAVLLLLRVHWLYRVRGSRAVALATSQAMGTKPSTQPEADRAGVDIWGTARAVWRAKKVVPLHSTCLQTALAMEQLFRTKGLHAAVRIGVNENLANAHAWVEIGNFVLDDQRIASAFVAVEPCTGGVRC